jgi:hypothetical protein
MATRRRATDVAKHATFVFEGTVRRLESTTMPDVPANERTVVVHVDRVLKAPATLAGYADQDITVELSPNAAVRQGQRAVFHTQGWRFGESLAVQSLAQTDIDGTASAPRRANPVQEKAGHDVESHLAEADLVVRGRVSRVRVPPKPARRAAASGPRTSISEHSPLWQEAVIDIDAVRKGRPARKQVVVRFPSSTDVRWARVPKFHPGQEGIFLLHKGGSSAYTALHAQDFQPSHRAEALGSFTSFSGRPKPRRRDR